MKVKRFSNNPIIYPNMDNRIGNNINGPSLIKVPDWVKNPLGKYYLYFAHHEGTYIRLAYTDDLNDAWHIHTPGVLDLEESFFNHHIASPDVRLKEDRQEIWMYFHGCDAETFSNQVQRLAISVDGLNFEVRKENLGTFYWRTFEWNNFHYALAMPGKFYRSKDGITGFEEGPVIFPPQMRHSAVLLEENTLKVFYTNIGDCPERILFSTIKLTENWKELKISEPEIILEPGLDYEGANLPLLPSKIGPVHTPVNQLRDPCIFKDDEKIYLLYSVAGEKGIAIAELIEDS